jgi:hypothetical protein
MLEFTAFLAAQQQTRDAAHSALPDAPVRPAPARARVMPQEIRLRQQISLALRRLADLVEPAPSCPEPAIPAGR